METVNAEKLQALAEGAEMRKRMNVNRNSETTKSSKSVPIYEQSITLKNWYRHINWINTTLVLLIPLASLAFVPTVPLSRSTFLLALFYYWFTGTGITAGYHRLFAHRSFTAALPLRMFLMCGGSGAGQGSIKWWSNGHRTHHRFTDTDKDPYDAKKGFFFSHIGWIVFIHNPRLKGRTDITDLVADPMIRFQHRHYVWFLGFFGYIFPALIAWYGWNDFAGGLLYAGVLRMFFVHQSTFSVNSLAHWIGDQPFDDRHSPRDHVLTALVTLGEGYHNFHHQFPSDYRNALKWYQYDPTKVFIWVMKQIGLAYNLQRFSQNAVEQGLVQQKQKKLDRWRAKLNWGIPIEKLPVMEFDDFKAQSKERDLVLISGIVHDVTDFVDKHPGGRTLIRSAIGKDGTAVFNGGVYDHSNAAHNLLATMRVGVVRGGSEVEVWKKAQEEKKEVNIPVSTSGERIVRAEEQPTRVRKAPVSGRAA